jgi:hypothetical protein
VGKEGGRGFVIEARDGERFVLTAAHCLPAMPEAHPWATDSRTWRVLGTLGEEPSVVAECCFADPVADIAVLARPSDMELTEGYDSFTEDRTALVTGCPPPRMAAVLNGWVLDLGGIWFRCLIKYFKDGSLWLSDTERAVQGGMSGSPILSENGLAIGVVSSSNIQGTESGPNPAVACHLPTWLLRELSVEDVRSRAAK